MAVIIKDRVAAGRPRGVPGGSAPRVGNGAMIAWNGLLQLRAGDIVPIADSQVRPYERTDQVEVTWR